MENSHNVYHKTFTQNEKGGAQSALGPQILQASRWEGCSSVSVCLVAVVIAVKVSVQGLTELLN